MKTFFQHFLEGVSVIYSSTNLIIRILEHATIAEKYGYIRVSHHTKPIDHWYLPKSINHTSYSYILHILHGRCLLRHVVKLLAQLLLHKRQLGNTPNLSLRLQLLLLLHIERSRLHRNNLRRGIGVVRDRTSALGAENPVDVLSGRSRGSVRLGGSLDGDFGFGDNSDEGVRGAGLALAIVAVVVADEIGLFNVNGVGDGFAEAVSLLLEHTRENHCGDLLCGMTLVVDRAVL
ncbi:hypothetical protein G7K_2105-t1 [Saitoella complicata NRRL Y-17804]|uniref:Uncharacterized protein n=1 Tax=Saitoella complicata (strain BCRC 22490 / CBS 7301 / JCM 7358 / NBRC 10748 / NRRL Y-17804) TaxID=698492 RepID=A0A0E9NDJ9_SAICN|nr:hypothetical protein G7K_2105-t1 [Saitoella complicata NRRL Y-17804]